MMVFFLLRYFFRYILCALTIPVNFNPQKAKNKHKINKDISKRNRSAFNNLNHSLSIIGGGLVIVGAALYLSGYESKDSISNHLSE